MVNKDHTKRLMAANAMFESAKQKFLASVVLEDDEMEKSSRKECESALNSMLDVMKEAYNKASKDHLSELTSSVNIMSGNSRKH